MFHYIFGLILLCNSNIDSDDGYSGSLFLYLISSHLHYGDITFTVSAAKMWNQLPTVIKLSGSVNIFKKNIKTHLFTQALD